MGWVSKLAKKPLNHQSGFTLLELLMVIAVIGILASIAVPRFQNATEKAKFTEVINAVGPYKTAVEMCIINKGAETDCDAGKNGIPEGFTDGTGKVASVSVVAGKITATGSQDDFGEVSVRASTGSNPGTDTGSGTETSTAVNTGITYELTPTVGDGISWSVGGSCKDKKLCD